MTNDTTFDKIEAWLSGQLSEAAAQVFEAEMASNPDLSAEVERHRRGKIALDRLEERSIQQNVTQWRESLDKLPPAPPANLPSETTPTSKPANWVRWAGGFALLLLLTAGIWFFKQSNPNMPTNQQKTVPVDSDKTAPIVVSPPATNGQRKDDKPVDPLLNRNKLPVTKQVTDPKLIKLADAGLKNLHNTIVQQYGQTMGVEEDENPLFKSGLSAFLNNNTKAAKQNLLKIPSGDPYYPAAQEMLAWLFFQEKNYPEAAKRYESFARQNPLPEVDWRLSQFYLADYPNRKTGFWQKMDEMLDPAHPHKYHPQAEALEQELAPIGIKRR
jgi:hypothetical protein